MNPQISESKKKTIFIKIFGEKDGMPSRVEISDTSTVEQVLSEQGLDGYLMFDISTRIVLFPREALFFRVGNGEVMGAVRNENPFIGDD